MLLYYDMQLLIKLCFIYYIYIIVLPKYTLYFANFLKIIFPLNKSLKKLSNCKRIIYSLVNLDKKISSKQLIEQHSLLIFTKQSKAVLILIFNFGTLVSAMQVVELITVFIYFF